MSVRFALTYVLGLVAVSWATWAHASLGRPGHTAAIVASVWRSGELVARAVLSSAGERDAAIDEALARPGGELVHESIVASGPLPLWPDALLALSLVPGHDGVVATLDGRLAYVTPDDLLAHHAYARGVRALGFELPVGVDTEVVLALLAERLGATAERLRREAVARRIRVERATPGRPEAAWAHVDAASLTTDLVRDAARDAARYLANNIDEGGRFRFTVDALTNRRLADYDWPRHAGATYFLAQAADRFHEPEIAAACLRAAALLRDEALSACPEAGAPDPGPAEDLPACVGTDPRVDLGSSALALLAFVEIARTGLDPSYAGPASRLARFLRAQQRPDGEFMHEFDRESRRPVDVQYLYYSGEATLALARAHRITGAAPDLAAARRALAHLVGPAWSFFGDRYYFGEEHWTCQAMAELYDRAPDPAALDFCLRWQRYGRKLQYARGETAFDAEGAVGVGPFLAPRLTPAASRCEAGLATLDVARRARAPELDLLERQQRSALALLVRRQLRPGPAALFADPGRVYGGMPGSEVDLSIRIDYVQHAGSAMIRWLDLDAARAR